jgi:hypothetical protein
MMTRIDGARWKSSQLSGMQFTCNILIAQQRRLHLHKKEILINNLLSIKRAFNENKLTLQLVSNIDVSFLFLSSEM